MISWPSLALTPHLCLVAVSLFGLSFKLSQLGNFLLSLIFMHFKNYLSEASVRVAEFLDGWSHITWFELCNIPITNDKYMNRVNIWKLYIYVLLYYIVLYYIIYKL